MQIIGDVKQKSIVTVNVYERKDGRQIGKSHSFRVTEISGPELFQMLKNFCREKP